jgi:phosphoribosylformimino-5-aminoimidazole carboxamide ribotide isomerase
MTKFRPCIDLHAGHVKQIVGGTLNATDSSTLKTNFVSEKPAAHFAALYREHGLRGGHMVLLGPGNDGVAREALRAWPGGLQVGGGVTAENAWDWIEAGAEKVGFYSVLK